MEKPSKTEETFLKNIIQDLPLDKPAVDFSKRVMQRIDAKEATIQYQPLITTPWKIVIGIALVLVFGWLVMNTGAASNSWLNFKWLNEMSVWNNLNASFKLSKTAVYAILFLGLFLLQVPYLKRMLEKQYS